MLRDNLERDLSVMFNAGEFATPAEVDGEEVNVIWEAKSDIALSGDYSSPAPAVAMRRGDVPSLQNGQSVVVGGRRYRIAWIEWKDSAVVKAYLAEDGRSTF